ncbi:MAG: hypothetical protein APF80_00505 [Alphaproteobacteria bacterium BRH_c36]|nr:MAG: hypothetical protein APF80_00505 [Alphaproteobacteria bacterium BRH_c36]
MIYPFEVIFCCSAAPARQVKWLNRKALSTRRDVANAAKRERFTRISEKIQLFPPILRKSDHDPLTI